MYINQKLRRRTSRKTSRWEEIWWFKVQKLEMKRDEISIDFMAIPVFYGNKDCWQIAVKSDKVHRTALHLQKLRRDKFFSKFQIVIQTWRNSWERVRVNEKKEKNIKKRFFLKALQLRRSLLFNQFLFLLSCVSSLFVSFPWIFFAFTIRIVF